MIFVTAAMLLFASLPASRPDPNQCCGAVVSAALARIREGQLRPEASDRQEPEFIQTVRTVELFRSPPPGIAGYQIPTSTALGRRDAAAADAPWTDQS
jgi:hypothetical protein